MNLQSFQSCKHAPVEKLVHGITTFYKTQHGETDYSNYYSAQCLITHKQQARYNKLAIAGFTKPLLSPSETSHSKATDNHMILLNPKDFQTGCRH